MLADAGELLQVPSREFDDDVIETRFEACGCQLRHVVLNLVKWDSQAQLCSNES